MNLSFLVSVLQVCFRQKAHYAQERIILNPFYTAQMYQKVSRVHLTFRARLHLALACISSDPNTSGQPRHFAVYTRMSCLSKLSS